jgi:hypothetical protein
LIFQIGWEIKLISF